MRRLVAASGIALIVLGLTVPESVGRSGAGAAAAAAAANGLQVTASNATPPDRVGSQIHVRLQGAIVANSKKLVPRRCRRGRQITILNQMLEPPGAIHREDLQPTPRSGRFNAVVYPYEYGGTDTDGKILSGDIGFGGGTLTLQVAVAKSTVYGKDFTKPLTCRPHAQTVTVPVPPATGG